MVHNVVSAQQSPSIDQIWRLQAAMVKMPQAELVTRHYFADGMYCRELEQPAGCLIVGKVHKVEHFFILAKGSLRVTTDNGVVDLIAPAVIVSSPGTKRAGLALEDSVCITVHRTSETDLEKIELALVEPDATALFNCYNMPLLESV